MKLFYKSLLVCFILAGLTSCDDEPIGESYDGAIPANSSFKVDINEETFFANISGVLTEDGVTQIVGKRNDGTRVSLKVTGSGTGTFVLNGTPDGTASYYDGAAEPFTMDNIDTVGVLEITKYDIVSGLASGTFSFKAQRDSSSVTVPPADSTATDSTVITPGGTLNFTNGEFVNIPLHTDLAPPPGSLSDFHVALDSSLYDAGNISAVLIDNVLSISTTGDTQNIKLIITDPAVGTFTLGDPTVAEAGIVLDPDTGNDSNAVYISSEGTLIITDIDVDNHVLSGTFTGTLVNTNDTSESINMTNGVFDQITYSVEEQQPAPMSAMIDNEAFEADGDLTTADLGNNLISITGTDANGNSLQLKIPTNTNTGDYDVTVDGNYSAVYSFNDSQSGTVVDYKTVLNSGQITINVNDGQTLSGEFTFSVSDSVTGDVKQITQGSFEIML